MSQDKETTNFDLTDIWAILRAHILPIILAAALCVSALYVYARFFRTPKYKSTATLYILKQDNGSDYAYTQSDFTLALNVVNDCIYMIKSHEVLDDTIDELGLNMSYADLYKIVKTNNPDGTRILEVSVEADTPDEAKRIADSVCKIGAEKISKTMSMDQVNIYNWGTRDTKPSNAIGLSKYFFLGAGVAVFVFLIYFIAFLFDDKVRTEDDVQRYLNLTVLGIIPNAEDVTGKKYKYKRYKHYGRYQSYRTYGVYGQQQTEPAPENPGKKPVLELEKKSEKKPEKKNTGEEKA